MLVTVKSDGHSCYTWTPVSNHSHPLSTRGLYHPFPGVWEGNSWGTKPFFERLGKESHTNLSLPRSLLNWQHPCSQGFRLRLDPLQGLLGLPDLIPRHWLRRSDAASLRAIRSNPFPLARHCSSCEHLQHCPHCPSKDQSEALLRAPLFFLLPRMAPLCFSVPASSLYHSGKL